MPASDLQLRACLDEPFVILGQRMHPLRLGHLELLHRCRLIRLADPAELIQAVLICSHWPHELMRYARRRSIRVALWLWRLRITRWDFIAKRELFEEYLEYHMARPEIFSKGTQTESAIPFHQSLRALLCSQLGYDPERVENVPMQRALWDFYAWAEHEGRLIVLPETSAEVEAALKSFDHDAVLARASLNHQPSEVVPCQPGSCF
jgi:hypothetical protein